MRLARIVPSFTLAMGLLASCGGEPVCPKGLVPQGGACKPDRIRDAREAPFRPNATDAQADAGGADINEPAALLEADGPASFVRSGEPFQITVRIHRASGRPGAVKVDAIPSEGLSVDTIFISAEEDTGQVHVTLSETHAGTRASIVLVAERADESALPVEATVIVPVVGSSGSPQMSFGDAGTVRIDRPPIVPTEIHVLHDGRILASGRGLFMLDEYGDPDRAFGVSGTLLWTQEALVLSDRILVFDGESGGTVRAVDLRGRPLDGFGLHGALPTGGEIQFGIEESLFGFVVQSQHRIFSYTDDGRPDRSAHASAVIEKERKWLGGFDSLGRIWTYSSDAVVRQLPNGTHAGIQPVDAVREFGPDHEVDYAFVDTDDAVLVGSVNVRSGAGHVSPFTVRRFTSTGAPDPEFGEAGAWFAPLSPTPFGGIQRIERVDAGRLLVHLNVTYREDHFLTMMTSSGRTVHDFADDGSLHLWQENYSDQGGIWAVDRENHRILVAETKSDTLILRAYWL